MDTAKREAELAAIKQRHEDQQATIDDCERTLKGSAWESNNQEHADRGWLLSDLARIQGAALSVPEIEQRAREIGATKWVCPNPTGEQAIKDCVTLLDALRAVMAEHNEAIRDRDTMAALNRTAEDERDEAREALRAKEAKRLASEDEAHELLKQMVQAVGERDEARGQLAQWKMRYAVLAFGPDEAKRLCDPHDARCLACLHPEHLLNATAQQDPAEVHPFVALLAMQLAQAQKEIERLDVAYELSRRDDEATIRRALNAESALALANRELAQAERDKAAMREGLRLTWPLLADRAIGLSPKQPDVRALNAWYEQHGALAPRDGEAEKGQESKAELFTNGSVLPDGATISPAGPCSNCFGKAPTLDLGNAGDAIALCERCARGASEILAAHRDVKPGNMRTCFICSVADIPRGTDWPWWADGKPVHAACQVAYAVQGRPKPEKPEGT